MKIFFFLTLVLATAYKTCTFGTKDINIDERIKTFSLEIFGNRAGYVNPLVANRINDRLRQKIVGQTKLKPVSDKGDFHIGGYINNYAVSTSGVTNGQSSSNRLSVSFHLILKNNVDDKQSVETDVSRTFDFPATQSLNEAERGLLDDIVKNITDEIFNKLFSNW
jgi:hypothetical protein